MPVATAVIPGSIPKYYGTGIPGTGCSIARFPTGATCSLSILPFFYDL